MNIFVANLNQKTTGEELNKLFSNYGTVTSAKVIFDKQTGNSKRYGFVEMPDVNEAKKAIEALNESELEGNKIVVRESVPSPAKPKPKAKRPFDPNKRTEKQ
ncbi:MAG TPA: RNA-binding protein [Salinivirgaceae bacterium]|nr:RNA-binding protein [Salinivirgaceae bacterium]